MTTPRTTVPRTIVVGVDASEAALAALEWACTTAQSGDRIVAVHAWELPVVTGYDLGVAIDPQVIQDAASAGLADIVERRHDERIEQRVARGHPGRVLVELADEIDADLIVVGPSGHGRIKMMLGSTASYVVHHTERPVAVVRGPAVVPRRVVVGVDDHDLDDDHEANESVRALRWAYQFPGVERINVVHAWFLPALAAGAFAPAVDLAPMDEAAHAVVDHVLRAAGDAPDQIEIVAGTMRGTPGFALVDASGDADLVVVGSRGRGGFKELLLGSTSSSLVAHAHSTVVVVR